MFTHDVNNIEVLFNSRILNTFSMIKPLLCCKLFAVCVGRLSVVYIRKWYQSSGIRGGRTFVWGAVSAALVILRNYATKNYWMVTAAQGF